MRPARQCRCQKAFFAAPAGRPIQKVGNAARTAVSTRCGPARMDRSASTCSGRFRNSSSGRGRRTSAAPARAVDALHVRKGGRNNSSASAAATVVRKGHSKARSNARKALSSATASNALHSSSKPRRKRTDSVQDGVAGGVAVAAASPLQARTLLRTRTPRCSNRGRRASSDLRVRRRRRVPIPRNRARRAAYLVPTEMVRNGADVSAAGAVGAVDRPADRRAGRRQHRRLLRVVCASRRVVCGYAALLVVGSMLLCRVSSVVPDSVANARSRDLRGFERRRG